MRLAIDDTKLADYFLIDKYPEQMRNFFDASFDDTVTQNADIDKLLMFLLGDGICCIRRANYNVRSSV